MRLYLVNGDFNGLFFGIVLMYCCTTGLDISDEVLIEGVADGTLVGVLVSVVLGGVVGGARSGVC